MSRDYELERPFDVNRGLLQRWPYGLHAIEDTLDSELIEGRARQALFRALNNKNLFVFVGTGVSAAYGRMDWGQLRDKQINEIERVAERFMSLCNAAERLNTGLLRKLEAERRPASVKLPAERHLEIKINAIAYQSREIARLQKTFQAHKGNKGAVFGGEIYPIQFQIAKRLHDALQTAEGLFVARPAGDGFTRGAVLDFDSDFKDHWDAAKAGYLWDGGDSSVLSSVETALDELEQEEGGGSADGKEIVNAYQDAFRAYFEAICRPGANLRFKDFSKHLIYDECPHAEHILSTALAYGRINGRDDWKDVIAETASIAASETSPVTRGSHPIGDSFQASPPTDDGSPHHGYQFAEHSGFFHGKQTFTEPERVWRCISATFPKARPDRLRRDLRGAADAPELYAVLGFFKKRAVENLLLSMLKDESKRVEIRGASTSDEKTRAFNDEPAFIDEFATVPWARILRLLWENQSEAFEGDAHVEPPIWTPTRRFIVGMLLQKLEHPLRDGLLDAQAPSDAHAAYDGLSAVDMRSRESMIRQSLDPLYHLNRGLEIRRFLTTNYDLEVERLFVDRGYRLRDTDQQHTDGAERQRTDPLGGVASDATVDRARLSELVCFALELSGDDASVYHLHGSATTSGDMVLTERDYMDLYLKEDEFRETMDETIDMAISANPILFVGLGMSEDDVLRPLRQFISNQERRWDRATIALLASLDGPEKERTQSSVLYTRYGVHALYYGKARVEFSYCGIDLETKKPDYCEIDQEIDWLRVFMATQSLAWDVNDHIMQAIKTVLNAIGKKHDRGSGELTKEGKGDKAGGEETDQKIDKLQNGREVDESWDFLRRLGTLQSRDTAVADLVKSKGKPLAGALSREHANWWRLDEDPVQRWIDRFRDQSRRTGDFSGDAPPLNWFQPHLPVDRHRDERSAVDGGAERESTAEPIPVPIAFELELLAHLIESVWAGFDLEGAKPETTIAGLSKHERALKDAMRTCKATKIGLEGIRSSVHTAFLTTHLSKIERDWHAWWSQWQRPPLDRTPAAAEIAARVGSRGTLALPTIYRRHEVQPKFSMINRQAAFKWPAFFNAEDEKIVPGPTGIRAFDTFLRAVKASETCSQASEGRRLFVIAAHRGLGKGVFMSAFSSETGLEGFLRASWPNRNRPNYGAAAFINYSFSTEISSTWDMLCSALENMLAPTEDAAEDRKEEWQAIEAELRKLPRLRRISFLLENLRERNRRSPKANKRRFLICLNAVDLLLRPDGSPKNSEIGEVLDLLFSSNLTSVPFDLVIIGDERRMPVALQQKAASGELAFETIKRPNLSEYGRMGVERRQNDCGIIRPEDYAELSGGAADKDTKLIASCGPAVLHFCRVVQPEIFMLDNFPILSAVLHHGFLERQTRQGGAGSSPEELELVFADNAETCLDRPNRRAPDEDNASDARTRILKKFREYALSVQKDLFLKVPAELSKDDETRYRALLRWRLSADATAPEEAKDEDSYNEWRTIRNTLRYNRFSLTLILSAAEYIALRADSLDMALISAERFIRRIADNVRAVSTDRAEEVVLSEVLDAYEEFHKAGDPERDIILHLSILRHLAAIGQPVSPDVLVRVPEIEAYFSRSAVMRLAGGHSEMHRRTDELSCAMDHLERAGLIFRLSIQPRLKKFHLDTQSGAQDEGIGGLDHNRFALHRLVHRHVMRKMGSSLTEFASTNSFAPSLFASMPSDLPRLDKEGYHFLRRLVAALSQYPDRHAIRPAIEPWHFGTADYPTQAQALRAALGVLRSTFSMAVVSRFNVYGQEQGAVRQAGCFEEHRVQLRWLIRKAGDMTDQQAKVENNTDPPSDFIKPLYLDEIVWLYNECGLTCLIQGNLLDAIALFRQALRLNQQIEGSREHGSNQKRISLNLVLTQIERGRLESAQARLREALAGEPAASDISMIATGYLGLVHHLRGQSRLAADCYSSAIDTAYKREDWRAAAIFCRHFADLKRYLGDLDGAKLLVAEAIAQAESGGHEDLLRRAQLSKVLLQREMPEKDVAQQTGAQVDILNDVTAYARTMDMPGLACDALRIRAEVMLDHGETTLAGKLLRNAISQAKRHGMHLRMISALTRYGEVMIDRRLNETAEMVLNSTLQQAKALKIQVEIDRIQNALERTL